MHEETLTTDSTRPAGADASSSVGCATSGPGCSEYMEGGYFKAYRKTWDNPRSRNPYWIAVWFWMLKTATHKEHKVIFDGEVLVLNPGQFTAGRHQIARETGVPEHNVKRILASMVTDQQIGQQTTNRCSLFTITNWCLYQASGQQNGQPVDSQWTASGQPVDTKQECKKVRMKEFIPVLRTLEAVKQEAISIGLPPEEAERAFNYWESNGWKVGRNPMKNLAAALRNWKRNYEDRKNSNGTTRELRVDRAAGTANEGIAENYRGLADLARIRDFGR